MCLNLIFRRQIYFIVLLLLQGRMPTSVRYECDFSAVRCGHRTLHRRELPDIAYIYFYTYEWKKIVENNAQVWYN